MTNTERPRKPAASSVAATSQTVRRTSPVSAAGVHAKGVISKAGSTGGLVAVLRRNLYYQDQADKTTWTARVAVGVMALSCIAVFFSIYKDKQNVYFAADNNGSFINLVPLSRSNQTDATVSNWVSRALLDTFDFHYGNYKSRLNDSAMKWFTRDGAEQLVRAMKESGNLDAVESKQMFVTLTLKHNPIVLKAGVPPGATAYAWKMQVEGTITYTNTAKQYSNNVLLTIVVTRRSLLEEPSGLGISKILMKSN